jgi:hypothetical protein
VAVSPLDACTMKVTVFTVLRDPSMMSRFGVSQVVAAPAISVPATSDRGGSVIPALVDRQENDLELASRDSPFRNSSSARFPARCAAR